MGWGAELKECCKILRASRGGEDGKFRSISEALEPNFAKSPTPPFSPPPPQTSIAIEGRGEDVARWVEF